MTTLVEGEDTTYYLYNGQGDRIAKIEDGVQTPYILDLNAGLTQVLNDGTSAYVYGLDLVSQQTGINEEYPLRDALGSVRQLTDQSSAITGSRNYEPYGSVLSASGEESMAYGFAGEWTDASGMQYLRARYYDPSVGRFFQSDALDLVPYRPQNWNHYNYVNANPVNYSDPSGNYPEPPPLPNPNYPIIKQAVEYFTRMGYSVVGSPETKSIYANGADIVFQKLDKIGRVLETLGVECKTISSEKVTLGTIGKNVVKTNYGGSIDRILQSADRLRSSSKEQLRIESEAVLRGGDLKNLRNVLFTNAKYVSMKAKDLFNYVYLIAADGTVTVIKTITTFSSRTIAIPGLLVPYYIINPQNFPLDNPRIPT